MMLIKTLQNQILKIDSKSYLVHNFQHHNARATSTHVCQIINEFEDSMSKKKNPIYASFSFATFFLFFEKFQHFYE